MIKKFTENERDFMIEYGINPKHVKEFITKGDIARRDSGSLVDLNLDTNSIEDYLEVLDEEILGYVTNDNKIIYIDNY